MYKRILVPVDGNELTDRAIEASIELAQQLGAAITGFVAEPLLPVPPGPRPQAPFIDGDRPAGEHHVSARAFPNSHDAAAEAARFDWREMQHRRVTDWQTVHTAHHDNI